MSVKMTKKAVVSTHGATLRLLSGQGANLLSCLDEWAHTEGVYGVNAHVYSMDGVAIVCGVRPFGKSVPRELVDKYEREAKDAVDKGYPRDSFTRWNILSRFINEACLA